MITSVQEAQLLAEQHRIEYNTYRPHSGIRDRFEETDQVEIGFSGCGFGRGQGMTAAIEPNNESLARAIVLYSGSALATPLRRNGGCLMVSERSVRPSGRPQAISIDHKHR